MSLEIIVNVDRAGFGEFGEYDEKSSIDKYCELLEKVVQLNYRSASVTVQLGVPRVYVSSDSYKLIEEIEEAVNNFEDGIFQAGDFWTK